MKIPTRIVLAGMREYVYASVYVSECVRNRYCFFTLIKIPFKMALFR